MRRWQVLAVGTLGLAGMAAWLAYDQVGRTPREILSYLRQRLEGHPKLELLALPAVGLAERVFVLPEDAARALPFQVPRLAPNPAASVPVLPAATAEPPVGVGPRTWQVGKGRPITSVAQAARQARDGDTVEIDPGDYLADVAVWTQKDLTIRGTGPRVRLIASGAHAEGKATWVIRGGRVTVEGIDFIGSRVSDRNGAGIRFERGHLVVRRCLFHDNQNGILTASHADAVLEVEQSEFSYNGAGDGFTHHLYANKIALLKVSGSWFHHGNVGHLLKSHAARSEITYNRLSDETGGRASYELEFPNGGDALVLGNIIQQGSMTSNSVMVSYGAEGLAWPLNRLRMAFNTLANDHPHGGSFVRAVAGAELVLLQDNLLVGRGRLALPEDAVDERSSRLDWDAFAQAAREDYRLVPAARQRLPAQAVADLPPDLVPRAEYRHPAGLVPLSGPSRHPGALQTPAP